MTREKKYEVRRAIALDKRNGATFDELKSKYGLSGTGVRKATYEFGICSNSLSKSDVEAVLPFLRAGVRLPKIATITGIHYSVVAQVYNSAVAFDIDLPDPLERPNPYST